MVHATYNKSSSKNKKNNNNDKSQTRLNELLRGKLVKKGKKKKENEEGQ